VVVSRGSVVVAGGVTLVVVTGGLLGVPGELDVDGGEVVDEGREVDVEGG